MRFIKKSSGLNRIKNNRSSYTAGFRSDYYVSTKREESEDTKIRKDIYTILNNMARENKSSIEIKYALTDKYPNYEEYIIKMINQYFGKINSNKKSKTSNEEKGDER